MGYHLWNNESSQRLSTEAMEHRGPKLGLSGLAQSVDRTTSEGSTEPAPGQATSSIMTHRRKIEPAMERQANEREMASIATADVAYPQDQKWAILSV